MTTQEEIHLLEAKLDKHWNNTRALIQMERDGFFWNRPRLEAAYFHLVQNCLEEVNYLRDRIKFLHRKVEQKE